MDWHIYLRDQNLRRQGEIDDYTSLSAIPRRSEIGKWTLSLSARASLAADLSKPGWGIEVYRHDINKTLISGPVGTVRRTRTDRKDTFQVSGMDDMQYLAERLAHPCPAESFPPYTTQEEDVQTSLASNVLRYFVNVNAGPGAISPRRVPGLLIGSDPNAGGVVTGRGRWQNLLKLCEELATAGGVNYRVVQVNTFLVYEVYATVDKSATVKFSEELGNLAGYEYEVSRPEANYVFVGGEGEGTARTIKEYPGSASIAEWGRIEADFADDRDGATTADLDQTGAETLAEGQGKVGLSITPIDIPGCEYGVDYQIGDKVSVVVGRDSDGEPVEVADVIQEAQISIKEGAIRVEPELGTPKSNAVLNLFKKLKNYGGRITDLERR